MTWAKLRPDLARIRRDGFALSEWEFQIGVVSLAVPVPVPDDQGPLAINVSLPSLRAGRAEHEALVARLRETAAVIGTSLRLAA